TDEFTKRMAACKKLCPHFHLSLQSGCDSVLKKMNRKYSADEYFEGVNVLRKYFENPAITTDIIVGFPQESDEEFEETLAYAKKVAFSKIHVFKYSRRHGTVADKMPGQVKEEIKSVRSDRLIELEESLGREYRKAFKGKKERVLFEEESVIDGKLYMCGYNERYVRFAVPMEEYNKKYKGLSNEVVEAEALEELGDAQMLLAKV
ncbi:MAG: radical SAM protein, partial [Lachnospiraceae bacterium]|nr:radical SAM protein [Lachnospiraceae bacterium]